MMGDYGLYTARTPYSSHKICVRLQNIFTMNLQLPHPDSGRYLLINLINSRHHAELVEFG